MIATTSIYIIIVGACVLTITLTAVAIWLLYQWKKKAKEAGKTQCKRIESGRESISPPEFHIPLSFRPTRVQVATRPNDYTRKDSIHIPEVTGRKLDYRRESYIDSYSEAEQSDGTESDKDTPDGGRPINKRRTMSEKQWKSTPDIYRNRLSAVSLDSGKDSYRSPDVSKPQRSPSFGDRRGRKISVNVLGQLRKEGKRVSVQHMALPDFPNLNEVEDQALLYEHQAASPTVSHFESDNEVSSIEEKSSHEFDHPSDRTKRRIGKRRGRAEKTYHKTGKITFTTVYVKEERKLDVHILRAFDLGKRKDHNNVNPFIRLYLHPGKRQKQHTKVQRKTKNPFFNEKRTFHNLEVNNLQNSRLKMKCYNRDSIAKNELLGEMDIALSSLNITAKETFNLDLFKSKSEDSSSQIMISLCHQATSSELKVLIHKAKNLPKVGIIGNPDPYVRVLLCRESGWEKKETKSKRNTRNPVWNDSITLKCSTDSQSPLGIFSLVVSVIHHSFVGKDEIVGHVFFSLDAKQESAMQHWKNTGENPHKLEAQWHSLIDPEDL